MNPALAASEFHGRVGSAGPNSSPTEADGLAQSCVRAQARFPQRPDWPDPQSQSFSRSYGSNLPTSLTYIFLSTRGYTPRRPDAVMSTTKSANKNLPRIFKGQRKRTRHPKNGMLYQPLALSPAKLIPRTSLL